ncbi:MAG TPA: MFS transporter [Microlunatus sp.]|nr:MFS transporter [Microlunatus sp.]
MTDAPTFHPRRWAALVPLLFVVFLDMVDSQIVTVALPSIRAEIAASGSALEWIAAGYTLTFALLLITGGRLGDRYGRKGLVLIGSSGSSGPRCWPGWRRPSRSWSWPGWARVRAPA